MAASFSHTINGRGGGTGGLEPRRQEKGGQEAGFPRWREPGEIEKNFATFCNFAIEMAQIKEAGTTANRSGNWEYW